MAVAALLELIRRGCEENNNCEKPTSNALKTGVPAAITGTFVLVAIIVCCVLYFKRQKRDDREDLEDRRRVSGYYSRDGLTRFGAGHGGNNYGPPGHHNNHRGPDQRNPMYPAQSASRRSSGESFLDLDAHKGGPYRLAEFNQSSTDVPPGKKTTEDGWRNLSGDNKPNGPPH